MAKDTRERILEAALEMFSKNGYAGTRPCLKISRCTQRRGFFSPIKAIFRRNTGCISRKINAERRKKDRRWAY